MRIAHVTATFPPYQAGTGNVCLAHARELVRRGHTVHVFTAAARSGSGVLQPEVSGGMHVRRLHTPFRAGNAPVMPALAFALRAFDVIHLHYPFVLGAEMVRAASLLNGAPLVLSFHNDLAGRGLRSAIFSLYQRVSCALTVATAARLCVVSRDHYDSSILADSLRRTIESRPEFVVELPNGVDVHHFREVGPAIDFSRYRMPADARIVLFVAALDRAHHFKGLDRLLRAMPWLPPDVRLLIVGDGDLRAGYEQQARRLGIDDRTVFAGRIDHDDLPDFYRSSHVTVLPSTPPESFGLVLIESMACGTPVVASRIPGVRTVVDDGIDGLLVDSADAGALARGIDALLADNDRRKTMGSRGRAKVEARYAWETIGARLEAIYQQTLSQGRRSGHAAYEVRP